MLGLYLKCITVYYSKDKTLFDSRLGFYYKIKRIIIMRCLNYIT